MRYAEPDEPDNRVSHYVYAFAIDSAKIFGSQDPRYGFGVGYGYGKPEPRFAFRTLPAQLVYEGYYDQTGSHSNLNLHGSNTFAFGGLVVDRLFWPKDSEGRRMFADLGFGFQYANEPSFDLDTHWNSTPIAGFGALFPMGRRDFMLSLRLLHISNAGTDKPNRGQNEIVLTMGARF